MTTHHIRTACVSARVRRAVARCARPLALASALLPLTLATSPSAQDTEQPNLTIDDSAPIALPEPPPSPTVAEAEALADRAAAWLITQQDDETGGWSHNPEGPNLPAITALVVRGLLMDPEATPDDPAIAKGLDYILGFRQPDGGIHDNILATYNTAICMSALALAREKGFEPADEVIAEATPFLKGLQWGEGAIEGRPDTGVVEPRHAFYGGWGYGRSGRPDLSNTSIALEALHDVGVPADDPAFQRALTFLRRTQMLERAGDETINDMRYATGSTQGGFIYSTSPDRERVGEGESKAGTFDEIQADSAVRLTRLRAYGSMTYAGFKSMVYADLAHDDPRVEAATRWLSEHFTVDENPGIGLDGYFYYLMTMGRALAASEHTTLSRWHSIRYLVEPLGGTKVLVELGERPGDRQVVVTLEKSWGEVGVAEAVNGRLQDGTPVSLFNSSGRSDLSIHHAWADALLTKLMTLQTNTGAFPSLDDRWMEDNEVLITAYSLLAARHAIPSLTAAQGTAEPHTPAE